jgi:hypothetical protein
MNKMTIKEIKELRVQQEEISKSNSEETRQALKQLDELEQKAHDDLVKKIAKHFKGIKPSIVISTSGIWITIENTDFMKYVVGKFEWNNITSKLAHTIKGEYEEVYGEPKECCGVRFNHCYDTYIDIASSMKGFGKSFLEPFDYEGNRR